VTRRVTLSSFSSRSRALFAGVAVALGASATLGAVVPGAAAPADDLTAKRAKAKQLASQIEASGQRISILDEQYNNARIKISELEQQIASDRQALQTTRQDQDRLRRALAQRAVELYTNAGSDLALPQFQDGSVQTAGARAQYVSVVQEDDRQLVDQIENIRDELKRRSSELDRQLADAQAQKASLARQRDQIASAQSQQRQLLGQVQGDIKRLVAEEQAREAAAQAAAARRALLARQAAARVPSPAGSGAVHPVEVNIPPAPPPSSAAGTAVATARAQLGKPYRYAASGPDSFDCSGLTMYAWRSAGVSLPHSSGAQYASLPHVAMSQLQPGDLVFFGRPIHHVGMFVGGGTMIHAPETGDVVKYSTIYRRDYVGAARPG
jgi:cell wall-associated NlpC family hydrolase